MKYVSTIWLCLECFVNRELKKYSGLKFYFLSEGLHDKRFRRLVESYKDLMTKFYILFFFNQESSLSPILTNFYKEKNPWYAVFAITCKLL